MHSILRVLFAVLLAVAAAADPTATFAADPRTTHLEFKTVIHTFGIAADSSGPGADSTTVDWSYPVFVDSRDPDTRALNSWLRDQSLKILLDGSRLIDHASKMSDEEVIERAGVDRDLADLGYSEYSVYVTPMTALGIYRDFVFEGRFTPRDGQYSSLREHRLYNMKKRREQRVDELFTDEIFDVLSDIMAAMPKSDGEDCPDQSELFGWQNAYLVAQDSIGVDFYLKTFQLAECAETLVIRDPRIKAGLKSPRDMTPVVDLNEPLRVRK